MILVLTPLFASAEEWLRHFKAAMPELEVRIWPDYGDPAAVDAVAVGHPPHGALKPFTRLRLIASLFAGQEALLSDPTLPRDVPIMRTGSPEGDPMMSDTVLLHVLRHHRYLPAYHLAQQRREWIARPRLRAAERKVGMMGLGPIGLAAAKTLRDRGFEVAGWARRPRQIDGVAVYHGREQLPAFLARSEILVNLLPLTADTADILCRDTFARLPRGAAVINLARGGHLVEGDLIAALDAGHLDSATLDVFRQEPLPKESPLWAHPRITVMPHVARKIDAAEIAPRICDNLRRLERGEPPVNLVDRAAGY